MKLDNKQIAIIILSIALAIALAVCSYFLFTPKPSPPYDPELVKQTIDELNNQIISMDEQLRNEQKQKQEFFLQIDSIKKIKQETKIIYVTKYKNIDNAYAVAISKQFDKLFANDSIR